MPLSFYFPAIGDGLAAYDAILPRERYLLGYPDGGGTVKDGLYWTNLGAEVHLGLTRLTLSAKATAGSQSIIMTKPFEPPLSLASKCQT
jgi:hypothetical protein